MAAGEDLLTAEEEIQAEKAAEWAAKKAAKEAQQNALNLEVLNTESTAECNYNKSGIDARLEHDLWKCRLLDAYHNPSSSVFIT